MTPPRIDKASIQAKLRLLVELVEDFDAVGDVDQTRLQDERLTRRAVERILTQAVDVAVSVTSHVAGQVLPLLSTTYRGSFDDAATVGLITAELAASMGAAAGMRNLLVHEYVRVDLALVAAAVPRAGPTSSSSSVRSADGWSSTADR